MRTPLLLTAVFTVVTLAPSLSLAQEPLTFADVRELARTQAFDVEIAEARVDQAEARIAEAQAQMLRPRIVVAGTLEQRDREIALDLPEIPGFDIDSPVLQHDRELLASVSADIVLFDVQALTRVRGAQTAVDAGEASVDVLADTLELAAIELCLQRVTLSAYAEVIAAQIALEEAHVEDLERRRTEGLATDLDIRRAESGVLALRREQAGLQQAQTELEQAVAQLLGGADPERLADLWTRREAPDPPELTEASPDALVAQALRQRADLDAIALEVEATESLLRGERQGAVPDLILSGRAGVSSEEAVDGEQHQWAVQLSLVWVPVDRGLRRARIGDYEAQLLARDAERRELTSTIETEVRTALSALTTADQTLTLAVAEREVAADAFRLAGIAYGEGAATALEVQQAQTMLLAAQSAELDAQLAHDVAQWRLAWAVGAL